jgi:FkbM family methyltransferase
VEERGAAFIASRSVRTLELAAINRSHVHVARKFPGNMNDAGTISATVRALFEKGARYGTVIDLGCADGHFFLFNYCLGAFRDACAVNIDANPLYGPSLAAIKNAVGGHFVIAAVSDSLGETELTNAVHPYWSSLRPSSDPYWERINGLSQNATRVPAVTVDSLREQFNLQPPFLLKLDVQGAEVAALRGARETLKATDVVICETDLDDFAAINRILEDADLRLFDLTEMRRIGDGSLGWFYPVYLSHRLDHIRQRAFWDPLHNETIIQNQRQRRQAILAKNAELLELIRKSGEGR